MSLEPLADYLVPQFGNIYDYNLPGPGTGLEVQAWTDKLRQAVTRYLLTEVDDALFATLSRELGIEVPPGGRVVQVAFIIEHAAAWEIAHALHLAMVKAVPTLDDLVGPHETWPDAKVRVDVAEWLDAHMTPAQLNELAYIARRPERDADTTLHNPEPIGEDFTWALAPLDLLTAWRHVVGPAESDLTDEEWEMLVPILPARQYRHGVRARSEGELLSLRRAFDGIRYRFFYDVPWSRVPKRYGAGSNLYQRYVRYREEGHFARLHRELQGNPDAGRICTWLDEMVQMSADLRVEAQQRRISDGDTKAAA